MELECEHHLLLYKQHKWLNIPRLPNSVYCKCWILATSPFWQMQSNPDRVLTRLLYRGAFKSIARLRLDHDGECRTAWRVKVFCLFVCFTSAKGEGYVTASVSLASWMFGEKKKTNSDFNKNFRKCWWWAKKEMVMFWLAEGLWSSKDHRPRTLIIKPSTIYITTRLYTVYTKLQYVGKWAEWWRSVLSLCFFYLAEHN